VIILKDIIIGVDGGGTATKAAALDATGELVAQSSAGSMNYNFIPVGECVSNVCEAIRKLAIGGERRIRACAVGDPSIDDEVTHVLSQRFSDELRIQAGFDEDTIILLKSDVFMSLYGLTAGAPGALIISGTGSMGMAVDKQNQTVTVGGWGNPGTDKGSGYDIAVKALAAVFDASDGIGPQTGLTEKALGFFKAGKPRELIGILNGENCGRPEIAAFAVAVSECAETGDETARNIISRAADDLAAYAISLLRRIDCRDCPVGMYGGVFQNNKFIQARFGREILKHFPGAKIGFPEIPPEIAAARYAMSILGINR